MGQQCPSCGMFWALKSSLDTQLDGESIVGWRADSWIEGLNSWM